MVRIKHQPVRRSQSTVITRPKKIEQPKLEKSNTLNKIIERTVNDAPLLSSSAIPISVFLAQKALLHKALLESIVYESSDNSVAPTRLERPWATTLELDNGNHRLQVIANNVCETFKQMGVRFDLISIDTVNQIYQMAHKVAMCQLVNDESFPVPMIDLKK